MATVKELTTFWSIFLRKRSHCFFDYPIHLLLKQRTKIHAIFNLQNDITFLIFGLEKKFKLHMKGIFKLVPTVPVWMQSKEVNLFVSHTTSLCNCHYFFFRYCEHSNLSIIHRVILKICPSLRVVGGESTTVTHSSTDRWDLLEGGLSRIWWTFTVCSIRCVYRTEMILGR